MENATRWAAAQTPRHKIHNLIQLSKLLPTSWATATHAVPSPCIPGNLDQRKPASFHARGFRARQRFISRRPYFRRLFSSTLTISQTLNLYGARLGWTIERARPFCDRDRGRRSCNERIEMHSLSCAAIWREFNATKLESSILYYYWLYIATLESIYIYVVKISVMLYMTGHIMLINISTL